LEGNVVNLSFPGAHSDIGGTYSADGISALTLQIAYHYLNRAGIPIAHEALTHEFHPDPAKFIIHDSRYLGWSKFQAQLRQPRAHADTQLPTHRISAPPG
ncbi:MAG: hypothetical protein QFF03_23945, partial [Pseudomonadota bacterium]|nr:hypothetical protein [Pseudomonadota bacterium]